MLGLDLGVDGLAGEVGRRAFETGLVIETSGSSDRVLKVLPPLTISIDERSDRVVYPVELRRLAGGVARVAEQDRVQRGRPRQLERGVARDEARRVGGEVERGFYRIGEDATPVRRSCTPVEP